jgi:hypothetical protein
MKKAIKLSFESEIYFFNAKLYLIRRSEYVRTFPVQFSNLYIYIGYEDDQVITVEYIKRLLETLSGIKIKEEIDPSFLFSTTLIAQEKQLPISDSRKITIYSEEALYMQIPINTEWNKPWFHSHFINLYHNIDGIFNYTDCVTFPEILETYSIGYYDYLNFNNETTFIGAVNRNFYILAWIDNYYNNKSIYYNSYHDIHPVLIYGYNQGEQRYQVSCFDVNEVILNYDIPFADLHIAIDSARLFYMIETEIPIRFMRPADYACQYPYENYHMRFLRELWQYQNSIGSLDFGYYYQKYLIDHQKEYFGIAVTEALLYGWRNPGLYPVLNYKNLHLVVENKKLIYDSLLYYLEISGNNDELSKIIKEYGQVVEKYEKLRILYIKKSFLENNKNTFYPIPRNSKSITNMILRLEAAIQDEKQILKKLFPILLDWRICKHDSQTIHLCNQPVCGRDEKGPYYEFIWKKDIPIQCILLFHFFDFHEGELVLSDGTCVPTHPKDSIYSVADYSVKCENIEWIRFYPVQWIENKDFLPLRLGVYEQSILINSSIVASSSFSERKDLDFSVQNVLEKSESFWCPEVFDKDRIITFTFLKTVPINYVILQQIKEAKRIMMFSIEAEQKGIWRVLYQDKNELGDELRRCDFPTAHVEKLRLRIDKTIKDHTGYDIPEVTYFAAFYDEIKN